jgi:hypothetical protein
MEYPQNMLETPLKRICRKAVNPSSQNDDHRIFLFRDSYPKRHQKYANYEIFSNACLVMVSLCRPEAATK